MLAAMLILAVLSTLILPKLGGEEHSFTIVACAAESTDDEPAVLGVDHAIAIGGIAHAGSSTDLDLTDPDSKMTFFTEEAYFDLTVRGKGIKIVTYSLNRGKIAAKTEYGNQHGTGGSDTFFGTAAENTGMMQFYDTLSVDFSDQEQSYDSTNAYYGAICFITGGSVDDYDHDLIHRYWHSLYKDIDYSGIVEDRKWIEDYYDLCVKYYKEVFGKVELNITVEYFDGSKQTMTVAFDTEWTFSAYRRDMLLYRVDDRNHTAEIVHNISEAKGVIYSDHPNYHLGEHSVDTDDDGIGDTVLNFTEEDIVHGYDYKFEGKLIGKLKNE